MAYRFFTIPIKDEGSATEELNNFLSSHRIVSEKMELIHDGTNSFWVVAVNYLQADTRPQSIEKEKKSKIDYREVLSEPDFQVYAKLRALRKSLSEQVRVPVYALFTNQQLAGMIEQRVTTLSALQSIEGIGESRLKKYGDAFFG